MVADMVTDMEVHMVADMEMDKVADKVADMVADMVTGHGCWLVEPKPFRPKPYHPNCVSSKLCGFIAVITAPRKPPYSSLPPR